EVRDLTAAHLPLPGFGSLPDFDLKAKRTMLSKTRLPFLLSAVFGMSLYSCQSNDLILTKKNMQFVGQFNKGFSYEFLGLGLLLRKVTFSQDDLIALAREQIPQAATLEDIYVVDVGLIVKPNADHDADF